jgi:predicted RNase H-like HicB family nuclease
MNNYRVEIFWSKKDDAFIAVAPAFDGLAVVADTRQEALLEAETAIKTYLQIYKEDAIPIPREDAIPEFSGQVRLRLSKNQHQLASQRAERDGVSLNSYLAEAVSTRNGIEDFTQHLLDRLKDHVRSPVIEQHQHIYIGIPRKWKTEGTNSDNAGFLVNASQIQEIAETQ